MQSYTAARSLFSFCAFLAWSAIIIGLILVVIGMGAVSQFAGDNPMAFLGAATPGLALAAVGLFFLIFVQMGRAQVDSAEYAQQSLKVARDQLAFAKEAHREMQNKGTQASQTSVIGEPGNTFTHNGKTISKRDDNTYAFEGMPFSTLEEAKAHIDNLLVQDRTASDTV